MFSFCYESTYFIYQDEYPMCFPLATSPLILSTRANIQCVFPLLRVHLFYLPRRISNVCCLLAVRSTFFFYPGESLHAPVNDVFKPVPPPTKKPMTPLQPARASAVAPQPTRGDKPASPEPRLKYTKTPQKDPMWSQNQSVNTF